MKLYRYTLAFFLCLFSGWISLNAQDQEKALPKYAISVEPLYLYNGGLRLNVEKWLKKREWIELNITGYKMPYREIRESSFFFYEGGHFTSNSNFQRFTELTGFGIGSNYKRYFLKSCLLSAGVSYTHYDVQYPGSGGFSKYTEDGLTFYEYEPKDFHQIFNKFTANVCIGARSSFQYTFFVEYYIGLGYAHSFYDENKNAYDESVFGFGYKGIYPTLGVKVGFNIR